MGHNEEGKDYKTLENSLNNTIKGGPKKLKKFIRRLDLPASHPIRRNLWAQIVSARFATNEVNGLLSVFLSHLLSFCFVVLELELAS